MYTSESSYYGYSFFICSHTICILVYRIYFFYYNSIRAKHSNSQVIRTGTLQRVKKFYFLLGWRSTCTANEWAEWKKNGNKKNLSLNVWLSHQPKWAWNGWQLETSKHYEYTYFMQNSSSSCSCIKNHSIETGSNSKNECKCSCVLWRNACTFYIQLSVVEFSILKLNLYIYTSFLLP